MEAEYTIEINRPAADVWAILSDRYADIGEWATAVPASRPNPDGDGRLCETPFRGFREVRETMLHHDEDAMTFTYTATSVPRWIGRPKNTWMVEPIDDDRCRAGFRPALDASIVGLMLFRLAGFKMDELANEVLTDLKYFAETGQPSPSKRAALAKR